jgi:hypothetical protein
MPVSTAQDSTLTDVHGTDWPLDTDYVDDGTEENKQHGTTSRPLDTKAERTLKRNTDSHPTTPPTPRKKKSTREVIDLSEEEDRFVSILDPTQPEATKDTVHQILSEGQVPGSTSSNLLTLLHHAVKDSMYEQVEIELGDG